MTLLKSIARLSDPIDRLQVAIKRDLKRQVAAMVAALAKDGKVYFRCDVETKSILFDTLVGVPNTSINTSRPETLEWAQKHRDRIVVCFLRADKGSSLFVDLDGMTAYFGWKNKRASEFVRLVLNHLTKREPEPGSWRTLAAILDVCRKYLKADDVDARSVERWVLLSRLRDGRIFELRGSALPVSQERPYDPSRKGLSNWQICEELDPIIDRMLEVGMTMEEIREEFLNWIAEKSKASGCRYQFMLAVAGAKCFKGDSKSSDRRRELLREHYLPKIQAETDVFHAANMFLAFKGRDIEAWKPGDEKFFRPRVIDLLACGYSGEVYRWLLTYGQKLNFYPQEVRDVGKKAGSDGSSKATAWEMMRVLAREAVPVATKAEDFGIAGALTQQFRDVASSEMARELIELALDLDQPVALSWRKSVEAIDEK